MKHRNVLDSLRDGILNDEITGTLEKVAAEMLLNTNNNRLDINQS